MKHKLIVLALFIAACFTGCATADKLNQLRIGMTEDQVVTIMGKSDSRSAQSNIIYLTYYLVSGSESRTGDQPYAIRLVDGKVESFGRFAQLLDMYNRPVPGSIHAAQGYGGLLGGYQGTTTYTTAQVPSGGGLGSELQKLKVLKDQGVLTEEEFQKAKTKLLDAQK